MPNPNSPELDAEPENAIAPLQFDEAAISKLAASRCRLWNGPAVLLPRQRSRLARGTNDEEHAMSPNLSSEVAVIGIDIGKNSFRVVGLDARGAIQLRQ
jgi:hypothetical protein